MNPKAMVNSNLKFNEALLKECKTKVCFLNLIFYFDLFFISCFHAKAKFYLNFFW